MNAALTKKNHKLLVIQWLHFLTTGQFNMLWVNKSVSTICLILMRINKATSVDK